MEALNAKDFMDKLRHDNLRPACILKGIVKKSDKDTEVLFKPKGSPSDWTTIPASMIGSVVVLKNIPYAEETMALVKLTLKAPSNPEAAVFFELLTALMPMDKCHGKDGGDLGGCGKEDFGREHSCHCQHRGCSCGCGCGGSQGCHCHHQ